VADPALALESDAARNACGVCAPLGATLAFAGVRGGMTLLHGSQGCATYIRRYSISHFREPLDVASSSFTEETAVFGGRRNLRQACENVVRKYRPEFVGVATTCLAETIGEDAAKAKEALADLGRGGPASAEATGAEPDSRPLIATVSTPSYAGDQREGFRRALRAIVAAACPAGDGAAAGGGAAAATRPTLAAGAPRGPVALFPTILSPADLRALKAAAEAFGLDAVLVTDYSDSLDGGPWREHRLLPEGGTPVERLALLGGTRCAIELGAGGRMDSSGAEYLRSSFGARLEALGLPIGVRATDRFLGLLSELAGREVPESLTAERERLLDAYVDAHKIVFERRVLLYGDLDLRGALVDFAREIGMVPIVAEGEGRDFEAVEAAARAAAGEGRPVDLLVGSSKGFKTAKKLGVPLVRLGFPIHDRYGGQRARCLLYGGTVELFDRIVNAIVERRQEESDVGYTYY
jgi:nitrogenase molybdenum-iron protein NifN